ncbi:MAG: NifU family protein [Nannocystaceae bacterium]
MLDRLRQATGLTNVDPRSEAPQWPSRIAEVPMWQSDKRRLHKHQLEQGIIETSSGTESVANAPAAAASSAASAAGDTGVKIYFKRGCPYTRAAMELLKQRDIDFTEVDVTSDEPTRAWLKLRTKRSTTPQLFINGESVGGYDELCELDSSGALRQLLGLISEPQVEDAALPRLTKPRVDGGVSLRVLRPEVSPFEAESVLPLDRDAIVPQVEVQHLEGSELVDAIAAVLDDCRPMVQADGGDIVLLDVTATTVTVELTGNCVGCPSANATLKQGIERRIRAKVPQIQELRSPQLLGGD